MKLGSGAATAAALLLVVAGCGGAGKPASSAQTQPTTVTYETSVTLTAVQPDTRKRQFLATANLACRSIGGKSLAAPQTAGSKAAVHAYAERGLGETTQALTLLRGVAAGRGEQALAQPLLAVYARLIGEYASLSSGGTSGALLAEIAADQRQGATLAGSLGLPSCAPASL